MSNISEYNRQDSEDIHTQLYHLHWDIYKGALSRVAAALTVLHKLEIERSDIRDQCRRYIAEFESLRERLENLLHDASDFRIRLIRENGCDGTCNEG